MRLFAALELPEDLLSRIGGLLDELRVEMPSVHWARPAGLHLTLKFLGEVADRKVDPICEGLDGAVRGAPGIVTMEIEGLGIFGDRKRPRIVWAGVQDRSGNLGRLQGEVETACAALGFESESRAFQPHLTLARLKRAQPKLGRALASRAGIKLGAASVESLTLMQSILKPDGALYVPLKRFSLAPPVAEPGA